MEQSHGAVGLERAVELRTKELVGLLDQERDLEQHGRRGPQLQMKIQSLKSAIKNIVNEDEVNPSNEWVIKAHELVDEEE
mmetsp:Transcript_22049/g.61349  ORF Transcript_22049/g.61349 Transcript_22049/m.61349 type:complete len:80 (-) Transcript_22049:1421-1660(-)|eukprot:CAMPEP_0198111822 /NCGR_PEP_ID=MMETSP1442-20131203/3745_1 /TAXON_ID= /ORGANISM="Craspedostauros australis, Strain CCMP3328" /LENGTH=79 /DNA_ID=CAMNT_0043768407 /DNA_START=48 /DNA_END=287 /DNA_ORIENTATION=-